MTFLNDMRDRNCSRVLFWLFTKDLDLFTPWSSPIKPTVTSVAAVRAQTPERLRYLTCVRGCSRIPSPSTALSDSTNSKGDTCTRELRTKGNAISNDINAETIFVPRFGVSRTRWASLNEISYLDNRRIIFVRPTLWIHSPAVLGVHDYVHSQNASGYGFCDSRPGHVEMLLKYLVKEIEKLQELRIHFAPVRGHR